jgi:hypothetical protein
MSEILVEWNNRLKSNQIVTYSTILGCLSCLRTEISLRVVLGMPSSSTSSLILCR